MQAGVEPEDLDFSDVRFVKDTRATRDAQEKVTQASNNDFYSMPAGSLPTLCHRFEHTTRIGDDNDKLWAERAHTSRSQRYSGLASS